MPVDHDDIFLNNYGHNYSNIIVGNYKHVTLPKARINIIA